MNEVKFKLVQVDLSNNIAGLWIKEPKYVNPYKLVVNMSQELMDKIKLSRNHRTNIKYEDEVYVSDNRDPMFEHNPLQFVTFYNHDGSFKNHHVRLVKEKGFKISTIYDRFGRKRSIKVKQEWRYSEYERIVDRTLLV